MTFPPDWRAPTFWCCPPPRTGFPSLPQALHSQPSGGGPWLPAPRSPGPAPGGGGRFVPAYNFDQDSLRYIRLSMPNKLPEYLASGAPVLAVGPRAANGIDYVLSRGLACCVTDRDPETLTAALRRLGTDSGYR